MKTLFLLRHAKSSWKHADLSDFERPLNKRGEQNAPLMGQRLLERGIIPELILSSMAVRARTTAEIVASELGCNSHTLTFDEELYLADPGTLLAAVQCADDRLTSIMLVAHNPAITELGNYLSGEEIENVPTAGLLQIEFEISSWGEVEENVGQLVCFDYPRKDTES